MQNIHREKKEPRGPRLQKFIELEIGLKNPPGPLPAASPRSLAPRGGVGPPPGIQAVRAGPFLRRPASAVLTTPRAVANSYRLSHILRVTVLSKNSEIVCFFRTF